MVAILPMESITSGHRGSAGHHHRGSGHVVGAVMALISTMTVSRVISVLLTPTDAENCIVETGSSSSGGHLIDTGTGALRQAALRPEREGPIVPAAPRAPVKERQHQSGPGGVVGEVFLGGYTALATTRLWPSSS